MSGQELERLAQDTAKRVFLTIVASATPAEDVEAAIRDAIARAISVWAADRREELAAMADDPAISDADFRKMALCYRLMPDTSDLKWAEEQAEAVKRGELG